MSEYIPLIYGDSNTNTLHRGRVSLAHEILSGIPQELVGLRHFYVEGQSSWTDYCNTIACGAGWLALHPEFQKMGLHVHSFDGERNAPQFGPDDKARRGFQAMQDTFVHGDYHYGITLMQNMFEARTFGKWDDVLLRLLKTSKDKHATDKELLLMRLRYAYQHHCGLAGR